MSVPSIPMPRAPRPLADCPRSTTRGRAWRPRWRPGLTLALALILTLGLCAGCGSEMPAVTSRCNAFGGYIDLSLVQVEPGRAQQAADLIRQDFAWLEKDLDTLADSALARVNRLLPGGQPFPAPPSILPLLERSQTYARLSGDLFNPAIGRLIALWGFNLQVPEGMRPPPDHAVSQLVKANPRMSDIQLEGLELRGRNPMLRLDFGAVARSYAIDLAIERLRAMGVRNALVQADTDLRAIGDRSGQPWRIPIRRDNGDRVFATLNVQGDESVVTRSTTDRDWIHAGVRYHSILDPRTGRPARDTQSVTVIHPDATSAAAAAIALFVAGTADWHRVAQAMGVRYALLIDGKGTVHMNPELHQRLKILDTDKDLKVVLAPPLTPAAGAAATP